MTRLELVSSGVIDLYNDVPISLNFSIADIENPDKRTMTYSKTITLPGTRNNNDLFKHIYEIDSYSNFNPNNKAKVVMYDKEVLIFVGYLKLNNIIVIEDKIEYEVVIYADTSNFYIDMGDRYLTDLDFNEYDHVYNAVNILTSWTAPVGVGYVYPMIDYGYGERAGTWKVTNFKPAVYVKTIIDKIFEQAGYTYSSPLFDSEYFKRLIIPYTSGNFKLTEDEMSARQVISYKTSATQTIGKPTGADSPGFPVSESSWTNGRVDINTETKDDRNQFSGDVVTIGKSGIYKFDISLNALPNCVGTCSSTTQIFARLRRLRGGVYTTLMLIDVLDYDSGQVTLTTNNFDLIANDQIDLCVAPKGSNLTTADIYVASLRMDCVNATLTQDDAVNLEDVLPSNVKQKEFFMSIVKMFNLYVDIDRTNSKNLIIEPRDDFYSSGTIIDWSTKYDVQRGLSITPTTDLLSKKYIYTYKLDKDYLNGFYNQRTGEIYGQKTYDVNSDFIKGEKKQEVIFSPTPLVKGYGNIDRYYSYISDVQPSLLSSDFNRQFNIRILYYGGLKTCTSVYTFSGINRTQYPYAGHLDDPITPYKDLSFGVPIEVYYKPTNYTNNNLFNVFHRQQVEEITNENARIITGYFYLTPIDINSLDFRNIYYVDGHYMRLLNIDDYSPTANGFCKCKFIKIKNKDIAPTSVFTTSTPTFYGGKNVTF